MTQVRVQIKMHVRSLQLKTFWDTRCIMDRLDEVFKICSFCHCHKFTPGPPPLSLCNESNAWGLGVFAQFAPLPATSLLMGLSSLPKQY